MKSACCLFVSCFFSFVLSAQNVGIGTAMPASKLEVRGETDDNSASSLNLTNQSGSSLLFVRNDGFVGVGKSNPWGTLATQFQPLEVNGDLVIGGEAGSDGDSEYLQILARNEQWYFGVRNLLTDNSRFFIGLDQNPTHFVIEPGGDVGIGRRNPLYRLEVRADSANGSGVIQCANSDASHFLRLFPGRTGDTEPFLLWNKGDDFRFAAETSSGTGFYEAGRFHWDVTGEYYLGIGTQAPTERLEVIGNIRASAGAGASGNIYAAGDVFAGCGMSVCSDLRMKEGFTPIPNALHNLLQLRGLYYFWKPEDFPGRHFSNDRQIGLIAQEVQPLFPEMITEDEEGFLWVDYSRFAPVIIEAIREQQLLIIKQESELNSLRQDLDEMKGIKGELNELRAMVRDMKTSQDQP